jgi:hypothetical protein
MKRNNVYRKLVRYFFCCLTLISPSLNSRIIYRKTFGRKLNLDKPELFNEKLMWLKLNTYNKNPIVTKCADKYLVREYVKDHGCEEILNDILYIYNSPKDINWDVLPNKFALKWNFGSGFNLICEDKTKLDIKKSNILLNKWGRRKYHLPFSEMQYKYINKKVICEPFLESKSNKVPDDYKIYCFNGVPKIILYCTNRERSVEKYFFDLNWNILDITNSNEDFIKRPDSLDKMIEYSKKLSVGFPFVRVDFYEVNGQPIFGEMTFTPAACLGKHYSEEWEYRLGQMINLK